MHDLDTRTTVFELKRAGHGVKAIARALKIARNTVRDILRSEQKEVPDVERTQSAEPHVGLIRQFHAECDGNLVRVHEKLADKGIELPYSTLTAFCRRQGIGVKEKERAGQYHFGPGKEMQHDTSPHRVKIAGVWRLLQCASVVFCFSRRFFAQAYPTFNRFYCKVFLTAGLRVLGGSCKHCMIDNTSVVIAHGTGKAAVPAPEMKAFSDRFNFTFIAHEVGDANRSARVERPFHYIENNFYKGRVFSSLEDLNEQMAAWCERDQHRFRASLQAKPVELYQAERLELRRLPVYIPAVYALHSRVVDLCGYVRLHTNRYSVPASLIGRRVEVRETIDQVRVFDGHRLMATHRRQEEGARKRQTLPGHEYKGRWKHRKNNPPPLAEEKVLHAAAPELSAVVDALKKRHGGRAVRQIRELHRLFLDYPTAPLCEALRVALDYGLLDLARIEKMVLRHIAGDFFRLPAVTPSSEDDDTDSDK